MEFVAFVVAFAVCVVALPALIRGLVRAQVIDVPNERSSHVRPTPRGAGLAIIAALLVTTVLLALVGESVGLRLMLPVVALGVTGAVDDFRPLSSTTRLIVQGVTALVVGCLLFGDWAGGAAALVLASALFLVAFTNAFNFMDGINGLSGAMALVSGGWFVWLGLLAGRPALSYVGAAIAGSCLAFLPFNFPQARIFLGDSGSYALGFALALLGLVAATSIDPWPTAFAPLVIYCADTGVTLLARVRRGDPLLVAHRDHVYQSLARKWNSHVLATVFVAIWVGASCGVAVVGYASGSVAIQSAILLCMGLGYVLHAKILLKGGAKVV